MLAGCASASSAEARGTMGAGSGTSEAENRAQDAVLIPASENGYKMNG